jgi:ornithine decarboxylase
MNRLRARSAVSPLYGRFTDAAVLPTVTDLVSAERPEEPMHCLRPAAVTTATAEFVAAFPGDVMYAVKCNPEPVILRAVRAGGVTHFDCASIGEVRLVRQMFADATIHFMHPVKARSAIGEAWERHDVRDFVLDTPDELAKIRKETAATGVVGELGLIVRLALPKGGAVLDLSGKFGASADDAAALLHAARPHAARLGVSFHVGSQCLDPLAWRAALALTGEVLRVAGVAIDMIDVGGGFPVSYPDVDPPPLGAFISEIEAGVERLGLSDVRLWAEPGRALVASGASVVVQVQQRRGNALYVNDGVYGSLADAGALGFRYPVRLIRPAYRRTMRWRRSRCLGRPATAPTGCAGRFCCRPTPRRATGSRSASSARTAPACAPRSTASIAPAWPRCATRSWLPPHKLPPARCARPHEPRERSPSDEAR